MTRVVQGCTRGQETQGEVLRWEECNAQEDWVHLDESVTVALTYYVWKYDLKTIEDKSWFELKPQLFFAKIHIGQSRFRTSGRPCGQRINHVPQPPK